MNDLSVDDLSVDDLHAAIEGLLSTMLRAFGVLKSEARTQPGRF